MASTLTCSKCKQEKPVEEFGKDDRRSHGRSSHCRACHRLYHTSKPRQQKARLNPGDLKTCNRCNVTLPCAEHFDKAKDGDGYVNQCKQCRRAYAREWKRRNKDHIKAYEAVNKDRLGALRRTWIERNRDRVREMRRDAYRRNPKWRTYSRNRAALTRTLSREGDITPEWLTEFLASQRRCYYCRRVFTKMRKQTIDHVIPVIKGGSHTMANVVVCCQPCNSKKRDRLLTLL